MNFRYRHTAGIYLELFVGSGYTDITFLVRGVQRLIDSVRIIIELKAGYADRALAQAENYVIRCPVSSISIRTSSEDAVCVGLNFDLDNNERLQLFGKRIFFIEKAINEPIAEIEESVRDYLLYPAFGVPAVPVIRNRDGVSARDRRIFLYTTGFTFGNATFAKKRIMLTRGNWVDVTKHLFHYHDDDKMLDLQGVVTQINVGNRALTMILQALLAREKRVIILNIRHVLATHQFPERGLDLSRWSNARVYELVCRLDPARRAEDDIGLILV